MQEMEGNKERKAGRTHKTCSARKGQEQPCAPPPQYGGPLGKAAASPAAISRQPPASPLTTSQETVIALR